MEAFLLYFDQFRYIAGFLLILIILCQGVLPQKDHYRRRLVIGCAAAVFLAMLYVPLNRMRTLQGLLNPVFGAPYWLLMSFVPFWFVLFCYETNPAGALFRTMLGSFVESFVTVLIRYLFVLCLFPDFPQKYPFWYLLLLIAVYSAVYAGACFSIRKQVLTDESSMYTNVGSTAKGYLFVYVAYTAIISITKMVCEYILLPLEPMQGAISIFHFLRYFLVADMLLICTVMTTIMVQSYHTITLRNEKQVITQMMRDRQSQYEFSRENIEMINRKAHDLKHQLKALEMVSDEERREKLQETRRAIDFYDAVVKTGNEALDTILTEKSVYCQNHNIRLSCMVNTKHLEVMDVVDLYTLLGNAIDNAIEGADRLADPDKKVISFTIRDQGQILYIHIENYFDGKVQIKEGLPVTRKRDRFSHGYGVKSIRTIARRYGGDFLIQTEGEKFTLDIMLPT